MRPINKGDEEPDVLMWKLLASEDWQPSWGAFEEQTGLKRQLLQHLAREQGYICCYCEQRISGSSKDCHLEHLLAKSKPEYRALALDHGNLLASCQGERPRANGHCGHLKDTAEIPVHPLMPDCREYFEFTSAGEILPRKSSPEREEAARRTIQTLGLGILKLERLRREVITQELQGLEEMSGSQRQAYIASLDQQDANGRLTPFGTAIQQVLRRYAATAP